VTGPTTSPAATVSGRIYAALRDEILSGRVEPGDPLPSERRLSDEHGASRHAVREALKRLQQGRLVSISHGGATRVRDWRRHGGLDLLLAFGTERDAPPELHLARAAMEMRACVGADAARRCAERADASRLAEIVARAEQLVTVDRVEARNAHYEVLWDLVVDGADNVAYRLALTTLVAHQRLASVAPAAVAGELGDPEAIRALARAIAERDGAAARDRARRLLERSIPEA
jgi:GntR family transcriptional regulator, transcriptional repressor for pyruvate dehydrogenase complex